MLSFAVLLCSCSKPIEEWTSRADIKPSNDVPQIPEMTSGPAEKPERVHAYIDKSIPMGGYIPPAGYAAPTDEGLQFREILQFATDELLERYTRGLDLEVFSVADRVDLIGERLPPNISSDWFNGQESNISGAVTKILDDLNKQHIAAAVLVTDMMATTGGPAGPQDLRRVIEDWLDSKDVLRNGFEFAILGLKADYWGRHHVAGCPSDLPLGCWLHEGEEQWRPLESILQRPVYLLMFGNPSEGRVADSPVMQEALASLSDQLREILSDKYRVGWEAFTPWVAFEDSVNWEMDGQQVSLYESEGEQDEGAITGRRFKCRKGGEAEFKTKSGIRAEYGVRRVRLSLDDPKVDPNIIDVSVLEDSLLLMKVDCAKVLGISSESIGALTMTVTGTVSWDDDPTWESWSSNRYVEDKTYRFLQFVEHVREKAKPARHEIVLPSFMTFVGESGG